jgi:hypothetical protein
MPPLPLSVPSPRGTAAVFNLTPYYPPLLRERGKAEAQIFQMNTFRGKILGGGKNFAQKTKYIKGQMILYTSALFKTFLLYV